MLFVLLLPDLGFSDCVVFPILTSTNIFTLLLCWQRKILWLVDLKVRTVLILQNSQIFWWKQSQTLLLLICLLGQKCVPPADVDF